MNRAATKKPGGDSKTIVLEELKKRYPNGSGFYKVQELKDANPDLASRFSNLANRANEFFGMSLAKYLVQEGILAEKTNDKYGESGSDEIEKLRARYAEKPFTGTLKELYAANPDIDWNAVKRYQSQSGNKNAFKAFLIREGIISEEIPSTSRFRTRTPQVFHVSAQDNPVQQAPSAEEKPAVQSGQSILPQKGQAAVQQMQSQSHAEKTEPTVQEPAAEMPHYEPPVYYVEEIEVSGEEANNWQYMRNYSCREDEIIVVDYLGNEDSITIPVSINGKKVINSSGLRNCTASTVKIPGTIKNLSNNLGFGNKNIKTLIIGEGVETIGRGCFWGASNLREIRVSRSVRKIDDTSFNHTSWYDLQEDFIILGNIFLKMKKEHEILSIPSGIRIVGSCVAGYQTNLKKVILPDTVTTLSDDAFTGAENIEEFIFSDSLVNIGLQAFGRKNKWLSHFKGQPVVINNQLYTCRTRKNSVTIPEGVVKICRKTFKGNKFIETVIFPSTLKEIDSEAFAECQKLTTVYLPEGLEHLGEKCFFHCESLSKVNLPDSLLEVSRSTFESCPALTEVTFGENIESIGEKAFYKCGALKNALMKDKVKTIMPEAFSGCSALSEVHLSNSLEQIGKQAFQNCASLEAATIPPLVRKLEKLLFDGCKSLKQVKTFDTLAEIEEAAFGGCAALTEVALPTKVGAHAFYRCTALKKVTFADGMIKVEPSCFFSCSSLEEITLPNSLQEIGLGAFEKCASLKSIVIPETVHTIGLSAFKDCSSLTDVMMNSHTIDFGEDTFTGTPYMDRSFGDFVIIGGTLSKYRGNDTTVKIPDGVTKISGNTFADAKQVESVIIPDSVQVIGTEVMGSIRQNYQTVPNMNLKKLVMGDGVATIEDSAFSHCQELEEVAFGKSVRHIGQYAFQECLKLENIDLSNTTVKEIMEGAFDGCINVKSLRLSPKIEKIGESAFYKVPLKVVELPKSVKKVENFAFDHASELIVYDTIDPDAAEANEWKWSEVNGSVNSSLACAMLSAGYNCNSYHITVRSAETGNIRYRIFCDSKEWKSYYRAMMLSAWGKHASFMFEPYDEYFMHGCNPDGRTEMAFCRIMYPEGLSDAHRKNYEAYLERCLYIKRSAKRVAHLIANEDAVERLQLLTQYGAIDAHNLAWIQEVMERKRAEKCLAFLKEQFSK